MLKRPPAQPNVYELISKEGRDFLTQLTLVASKERTQKIVFQNCVFLLYILLNAFLSMMKK